LDVGVSRLEEGLEPVNIFLHQCRAVESEYLDGALPHKLEVRGIGVRGRRARVATWATMDEAEDTAQQQAETAPHRPLTLVVPRGEMLHFHCQNLLVTS
jgi:hypothetical protein